MLDTTSFFPKGKNIQIAQACQLKPELTGLIIGQLG